MALEQYLTTQPHAALLIGNCRIRWSGHQWHLIQGSYTWGFASLDTAIALAQTTTPALPASN